MKMKKDIINTITKIINFWLRFNYVLVVDFLIVYGVSYSQKNKLLFWIAGDILKIIAYTLLATIIMSLIWAGIKVSIAMEMKETKQKEIKTIKKKSSPKKERKK